MKNFVRFVAAGALCFSNVMIGVVSHADAVDLKRENDELIARGGVVVFVSSLAMVSGVFGMGFREHADARSKDMTKDLGKVTQANSALRQQMMIGADPGDIVRFEFIPQNQRALMFALDDMKVVADAWAERVRTLEARKISLSTDIQNLKDDSASAASKSKWTAEFSRDLEDTKSMLKMAHLKAGESRANYMTTHANYEYATRHGVVKPVRVVMEIPIEHKMPMTPESALSRILQPDEAVVARGLAPSVRIMRFDARNTNLAMRSAKIAKRGFIGLATGVLIAVEEIAVGAIGAKMAERSAEHFAPETRIDPLGPVE